MPYHILEADLTIQYWPHSHALTQIIVGRKLEEDNRLLSKNQQGYTVKLNYWQKRPQLISLESSKVKWPPSIHRISNMILHIVGGQES